MTQLARTEDVVTYTEFCKQQQPNLSAEEIQPVVAIYDGLSNKITPIRSRNFFRHCGMRYTLSAE